LRPEPFETAGKVIRSGIVRTDDDADVHWNRFVPSGVEL
jgi:hypothetical protein